MNIEKALKQAENDKKDSEVATVFHRKDRESWKVTLRMDDFIEMYKAWKEDKDE